MKHTLKRFLSAHVMVGTAKDLMNGDNHDSGFGRRFFFLYISLVIVD